MESCSRWCPDGPCNGAVYRGKDVAWHTQQHCAMSCAKTAEPIEMPFGLWTLVSPGKHVLGGVHTGATLRIALNCPCEVAMRPFCQSTLTTSSLLLSAFDVVIWIVLRRFMYVSISSYRIPVLSSLIHCHVVFVHVASSCACLLLTVAQAFSFRCFCLQWLLKFDCAAAVALHTIF